MRLLWPYSTSEDIADEALTDLYRPTDRDRTRLRVNLVTSLDGAVAIEGRTQGLSGAVDKRVFGILRMLCDVLVVGAGTLKAEGYGPLDLGDRRRRIRRELGLPPDPPLVVVSARLTLSPDHPALVAAPVRPIVLTPATSPPDRRAALAQVADLVVAGEHTVDFAGALAELRTRGLSQVLCEGGPRVFAALTAADLVDELCLTLSPLLAGGDPGRLSAGTPTPAPRGLPLRHVLCEDDVLLLRYAR
jgi:riboflavin biosynthesis pyrimidine reductase